jgi:asparagine synthase (glutamine-hydrolysing)
LAPLILNDDNIINFLTLRYDPTLFNVFAPLKAEDFGRKSSDNIELKIMEIVERDLNSKLSQKNVSRISIALSGGVDSGFTLLLIRKLFPDLKIDSICVGFGDEDDETSQAKEIALDYNCDFHELYIDNVLVDLPNLISIVGTPKWNLYQFYSFNEAKKYSSVFFSGDGGDETFGGYVFRYKKFLNEINTQKKVTWLDKSKIYLSCHERDWVPDQERMFGKRLNFSWLKIYDNFKTFFDNGCHPMDQLFLADFNGKLLHDWIPTNHKFGKYLGLDINSLFLNPELIFFSAKLPWTAKYDSEKETGKLPLLSIMNAINGYKKFQGIKKGFSLNLMNMWKNYGKDIVLSHLNRDSDIVKDGLINILWINKALSLLSDASTASTSVKIRYISKMLSLLSLEIWYRIFVTSRLNANDKL